MATDPRALFLNIRNSSLSQYIGEALPQLSVNLPSDCVQEG